MSAPALDRLADLKMLAVLADTRSFTAAAQRLGVSKSLISLRMKALEQELGVSLLLRTTRSVRPTEAGALLIERARPALDTLEDSLGEVRNLSRAPRGRLRLTAPVAWAASTWVPSCASSASSTRTSRWRSIYPTASSICAKRDSISPCGMPTRSPTPT